MQELGPRKRAFFVAVLRLLSRTRIPFLVGGGWAMRRHTGIQRPARDLDLFVRPTDVDPVLGLFSDAGYRVDIPFPHWLGKVYKGPSYVDVIFAFGNGIANVDDAWFEHAVDGEVLGVPVKLCPAEEMVWSKAFVMERERYDGADVIHLILSRADLDWRRLLERFGDHRLVLLSHLTLFLFIFPSEIRRVPSWVWDDLLQFLDKERQVAELAGSVCRGTLLSRSQYLIALEKGYRDVRLPPDGSMRPQDVIAWTDAADKEHRTDAGIREASTGEPTG